MVALQNVLAWIPASKNSPLSSVYRHGMLVPPSDCAAMKYLKSVSPLSNFSPHLTFHSFRKSVTTCTFQYVVSLQEIMKHAVCRYIKSVPSFFRRFHVPSNSSFTFSLAFGGLFSYILYTIPVHKHTIQ